MPKMHQNTFGSRDQLGELMCSTRPSSRNGDGREGREERGNPPKSRSVESINTVSVYSSLFDSTETVCRVDTRDFILTNFSATRSSYTGNISGTA